MTPTNPYTLTFGQSPAQIISRSLQAEEIVNDFSGEIPSQHIYLITGVRGSGKTVFMTDISRALKADDGWITIELNPERDLLESLLAKLSGMDKLSSLFREVKINLSFLGFGVEIAGVTPIKDGESALSRMFEVLRKHGKSSRISRSSWMITGAILRNMSMKRSGPSFRRRTKRYVTP